MKIAIIGWGSLIWDPRDLPHYSPWMTGGPTLPIEFSRVSSDGRLTLVVCESGAYISTRFATSTRVDISDAVEDLRRREGTVNKHIGFYNAKSGENSIQKFTQQLDVIDIIKHWCSDNQFDACVWTALPSNFVNKLEFDEFSPENAILYLERIGETTRKNALNYIRNAPQEVDTPVRFKVSERWPLKFEGS